MSDSDHALIATTHVALWLFIRLPDDTVLIRLERIPGAYPVAWQPLRCPLAPGQTSLEATAEYLVAGGMVPPISLRLLDHRYNLPLLGDPPWQSAIPQCEETCVCDVSHASSYLTELRNFGPHFASPAQCQWFRALDALLLLRYAEHIETVMLLWQVWASFPCEA